ncbi:MAG: UDP-N-acetylmuramate--L-alanine ligase [Synechococcales bacterium]|nr:UDP-N-acetylmuramate--L-alanine ligase [Synechococcales bacterium]
MPNSVDFSGRPFHFIGIGGIGMSAIASILARRRLPVSGSDVRLNHITQRLRDQGVHIFLEQAPSNLEFFRPQNGASTCSRRINTYSQVSAPALPAPAAVSLAEYGVGSIHPMPTEWVGGASRDDLPQVVCSTAIADTNAEYQAALALGCPILHRSDVLAALMQEYRGIAIAGTHGKTTTSSMIGYLLMQAGIDPTIVVGGEVDAWEGNARLGDGEYLVAEVDESDGSLVKFSAEIGVITNIELDHPDHYSSLHEVVTIFQQFAQRCHHLIACIDCPGVAKHIQPTISYSVRPGAIADYTVQQIAYTAQGTTAEVWERGQRLGEMSLKLLGEHNLSNALAAIAVGRFLQIPFAQIAEILATFEGARRRFERRGEYHHITFIDDYAHHPSEIQATLAAARLKAQGSPNGENRRVVAIFQPHRYSRTLAFFKEFSQSFCDADLVITTDIYSAGEIDLQQVGGARLAEAIAAHHPAVRYQPTLARVADCLKQILKPGDLVLFLGAGNLNQIIPDLLNFYQQQESLSASLSH